MRWVWDVENFLFYFNFRYRLWADPTPPRLCVIGYQSIEISQTTRETRKLAEKKKYMYFFYWWPGCCSFRHPPHFGSRFLDTSGTRWSPAPSKARPPSGPILELCSPIRQGYRRGPGAMSLCSEQRKENLRPAAPSKLHPQLDLARLFLAFSWRFAQKCSSSRLFFFFPQVSLNRRIFFLTLF